jgi:hypothetical protein
MRVSVPSKSSSLLVFVILRYDFLTLLSLSGRSIEIIVGSEQPITFSVHENLISAASDFFKKSMNGDRKESKERSVRLREEDPEVFQVYLHWLYYHTLPVRIDSPGLDGNVEYLRLAKAYIMGDMLQDGNFKDAVLDAMAEKGKSKASDGNHWHPVGPVIRAIYDNTRASSEARRFLVDTYTNFANGKWLRDWGAEEDLPKEFLLDLAIAVLDRRPQPNSPPSTDACAYHQHAPGIMFCYRHLSPST